MDTEVKPRAIATRVAAVVAVLAAAVAACGLPTDDQAVQYNVDDLPPGLTQTTTTSTTTTTTTTTTVPESTLPGETTTTALETTTTTLPFETRPITVFYTLGSRDELAPLVIQQRPDVGLTSVIDLLEAPPDRIGDLNMRTSVPLGLIADVPFERAVATIVLDPTVLQRMSTAEERRAIAQMVLTFTSFMTPDAGNVGAVQFEVDGEPYEVFVPFLNGTSEPGRLLAFSDYAELITSGSTAGTTATTTTAVATTEPDPTATPASPPNTAG